MSDLITALETFLDTVWVRGETDDIADLMHDDAVVCGLEDTPLDGMGDYLRFHRMVQSQFCDFRFDQIQTVEAGTWVAMLSTISLRDSASGVAAHTRIQMTVRFHDGKLAEIHILIDYLALFEQLGRLPDRTLDLCLLQQKVPPVPRRA